mmetsp:Transcript_81589/g.231229  ORF Transcript_81589/g.231229 Transcript_81589/m.231229 type:complete len:103 (-) Transcript_81589:286-594(-)
MGLCQMGAPPAGEKPGGKEAAKPLTYKEKQAEELRKLEESLSAEEGFAGKKLSPEEAYIIEEGGTDQRAGPYAGRKFLPARGYFACRRCGACAYLAAAKFPH